MSVSFIFFSVPLIISYLIGIFGKEELITRPSTLQLVHVLFRHGNRTPNGMDELYPTDPYINKTYFPITLGQLTNVGKRREYSVGVSLRARYNNFLGKVYYPEIVDARSTDYNRTKASLQLVLAGLFPPEGEERWNFYLNWQPIPYNYAPQDNDRILRAINCPNYQKLLEAHANSNELLTEYSKYLDIFAYLSKNSGLNITSFDPIYNMLYFGLSTEEEWGLRLPAWTNSVWPKVITDLAIKQYFVFTGNTNLRKILSGYFLQKIIVDTRAKIAGKTPGKKIYLYSAHEDNIADALITLGVFNPPKVPTYGAHLIFEIHKIANQYKIKVLYQNYVSDTPELLQIPGCEKCCDFEKFVSLLEKYMPNEEDCGYTSKCQA